MSAMKCDEVRSFLVRLADGELEGALDSAIAAHVESCVDCQALVESLQQDRALLREDEKPEPPPYLATRVMASVREAGAKPARNGLGFRPALSPLALVLLAIVGISLGAALGAGISAGEPSLKQRLAAAGVVLSPEAPADGGE
jgi:anti-sigma factor RsiW